MIDTYIILLALVLAMLAAVIVMLLVIRSDVNAQFDKSIKRHEAIFAEEQILLDIVKEWAKSARIQTKESRAVLKEVQTQGIHTDDRVIVDAVEGIPEKTAAKVVEKIKQGDSLHGL